MDDPLQLSGKILDGKYLIQAFVSEGGFAVVYRAEHIIWKKPVAIKLFNCLSSAPEAMRAPLHEAFIQEGAFLSELSTETISIVQPRDVGTYTGADGQWLPYMVLEWLEGQNLEQLLEQEHAASSSPWTLHEVIATLGQVAVALELAHAKGIAHRDVKPANLFLVGAHSRAEISTIKVLDFGIAKMMADAPSASLAQTGANVTSFTPQYAAPEQFDRGLGATGPWTDVYSLALVAVELLLGRSTSSGDDIAALGAAAMDATRRPTPRALGVAVSDRVEAVFARALDVSTERRFKDAGELWTALEVASDMPPARSFRERADRSHLVPFTQRSLAASQPSGPPSSIASASIGPTTASAHALPALNGTRRARLLTLGLGALAALTLLILSQRPALKSPTERNAGTRVAPTARPSPTPAPDCAAGTAKIPAGEFFMGSESKEAPGNEKPSHHVTLDPFCMDLYEVTAGQYKACADVGKCKRAPKEVDWPKISDSDRKLYSPMCNFDDPLKANHPINCVTWEMADNYCAVNGKRLPTEAEWEFATRGPDGRVYPWGDDPPTAQHLNACGTECSSWGKKHEAQLAALYDEDDGYVATAPVGSFPKGRSRFGPYDVVGNVWEWTSTWYGPYSVEKSNNPQGPEHGERRVIRGGAFNGGVASWLHPSFRYGQLPDAQSHGIGFRCVANIAATVP